MIRDVEDVKRRIRKLSREVAGPLETPCWIWAAAMSGSYGKIKIEGKQYKAHRAAFSVFRKNGRAVPKNKLLLHACDTPACCNPYHTKEGNQQKNMAEANKRGRAWWCKPDSPQWATTFGQKQKAKAKGAGA